MTRRSPLEMILNIESGGKMHKTIRLVRLGLTICFGLSFSSAALLAQTANGRVLGTITDPSGAAIAGANVTVINTDTRLPRETATDKEGSYQVLDLPIGTYSVTAEAAGFSKAVTAGQKLLINQSLRIDLSLEVGSTTNTVQVEGTAAGVETVNATLGQSVTSRPIVNLPLNGRNVLDLALLQPGVTPQNPQNGAAGTFSIAGGRTDSVTFLLDGGLNNNLLDNSVVYNPNPDTVAEFRLLTSNYTAEYGRNGGGIISVVTKSGTNDYHGSLFDYIRNNDFNANSFFSNEQGIARPVLKRNQFGATVGGPISIPKLIHGRDRMFFFIGYQGQRQVSTTLNGAITTFTPAEAGGDFSSSNPNRSGPDPRVVSFLQKNPFFQSDPGLAARGIIDPNRINPIAKNYFKNNLVPTDPSGRIFSQDGAKDDRDELTEKFDFLVTKSDRLSVTLGSRRNPRLSPFTAES
ncbi:MAG: Plug and carboxypeptidase regulatory-like domain-containing protein, partial [Acidobacteriota bacterium]|nr:Plug and carboxypeptidase regulatory-like domain-containing protein [Acidobacteriota bacterium]